MCPFVAVSETTPSPLLAVRLPIGRTTVPAAPEAGLHQHKLYRHPVARVGDGDVIRAVKANSDAR